MLSEKTSPRNEGLDMSPMANEHVILYLVEDSDFQASIISDMLKDKARIELKCFADGYTFLAEADFISGPVVLFLDLFLPDTTGINLLKKIKMEHEDIIIICWSARFDTDSIRELYNSGAYDVVEKGISPIRLLGILQDAANKARNQWNVKKYREFLEGRLSSLSVRERDILDLLVLGKSSKEIAFLLDISPRTVDVHRSNALNKIGISSIITLAVMLTGLGMIKVPFEEFLRESGS